MIIGLTGTLGSGKTTVAKYLEKRHGFIFHSLSDSLREIAREKGTVENRETLGALGTEIRNKFGYGELSRRLLNIIKKNKESGSIVDGIRHPAEIEELRKAKKFILLSVDAPLEERYRRIQARQRAGDNVTLKEFKRREQFEMGEQENSPMQIKKCMEMADHIIWNNGDMSELGQKIDKILR